MNRRARRAERSKTRKTIKGEIKERTDVAVGESLIKAQLVQDEVQRAIKRTLGNEVSAEDLAVVITCLGMTAAGLACQIGVSEQEFVDKMASYIKQVRAAVGLQDETQESRGPSLVLP